MELDAADELELDDADVQCMLNEAMCVVSALLTVSSLELHPSNTFAQAPPQTAVEFARLQEPTMTL